MYCTVHRGTHIHTCIHSETAIIVPSRDPALWYSWHFGELLHLKSYLCSSNVAMISLFCFTTLLPTHGSIVSGNARAILTQECWKPGHNCNSLQLNHMITINIISVLLTICCTFRGHLSLGRHTSSCTLYKASNTIQSIGTVHTFQCFVSLSSWHITTLSLYPQNC